MNKFGGTEKILIYLATEFYIGQNLFTEDLLSKFFRKQKTVLIADAALKELYAIELAKKTGAELLTIPSGETAKSLEVAEHLIDELFKMGVDRETQLVAFGGGVTTDVVGFVASIYKRGVPLILVPTTLLAIVDAAIGGKNGIDTFYGKNLIGTIYFPKVILANLDLLQTLPEKEAFNGLAEMLKIGLIQNPILWEKLKKNPKEEELILEAAQGKIDIVEKDPFEQGMRRILNFGHTIGHALEKVSDYEMSHGEAVAIGTVAEAHLSMRLGYLSKEEFDQIEKVYRKFPLKLPKTYNRAQFLSAMAHDKKQSQGQMRFVLIDKIGHAMPFEGAYCRKVSLDELEETLNWMETWKSDR